MDNADGMHFTTNGQVIFFLPPPIPHYISGARKDLAQQGQLHPDNTVVIQTTLAPLLVTPLPQ